MKEIGRDNHFIAFDNGVVCDTSTGLEWFAGPDRNTTWNEAKSWAENFIVDKGGWRMPNLEELKNLYKEGAGTHNMTPLLKTTGKWVWSGVPKDSAAAWIFDFSSGDGYWSYRYTSCNSRGFAVRSRREEIS